MSKRRKIGVFTSARSEYGSFRELLQRIEDHPEMDLCLLVSGNHLSGGAEGTLSEIEADGFEIAAKVKMFIDDHSRGGYASALGRELMGLADVLDLEKPDLLMINGDRGELLPVATVALALNIPLAHIAGGEITEGALDDAVRHAVTKLSHLHFATNVQHAKRICQMGEEDWRVTVTGEPGLDIISKMKFLPREELGEYLDLTLDGPVVLVTYHPETLGVDAEEAVSRLLEAMDSFEAIYVITYPNADPGSEGILQKLKLFCSSHERSVLVSSLGQVRYYSMMKVASMVLGNSSSGLWEAPSFELPVVNVGGRQDGRLRGKNVIDVSGCSAEDIKVGMDLALSEAFKNSLIGMNNPYGNGKAIDKIMEVIESVSFDRSLLRKKFIDHD